MEISIVIPALNESLKIKNDVEAAVDFCLESGLKGEVIVVDDGSTDGTAEAAQKAETLDKIKLRVIRLDKNHGKGYAVKKGILESQGDIVLFADSGTCVPYSNAIQVIDRIKRGELDIALGSRCLKETKIIKNRPWGRRVLSRIFHFAAVRLAGLPSRITDSQCGFKVFNGKIARLLFAKCETIGFLFDVEILLRAHDHGYRIEEFPIEWSCDLDTRLRPASDAPGVLRELFSLRKIIKDKDS